MISRFALFSLSLAIFLPILVQANTECVWATGRLVCNKNQSLVVEAVVEVWDLDSPQNVKLKNPIDPDDKAGFSLVEKDDGIWNVEGCASDVDWLPGIHKNRPEFYIRVFHKCNKPSGEYKTVLPIFTTYVPKTYDYHIEHPIVLDD